MWTLWNMIPHNSLFVQKTPPDTPPRRYNTRPSYVLFILDFCCNNVHVDSLEYDSPHILFLFKSIPWEVFRKMNNETTFETTSVKPSSYLLRMQLRYEFLHRKFATNSLHQLTCGQFLQDIRCENRAVTWTLVSYSLYEPDVSLVANVVSYVSVTLPNISDSR